MGFYSGNGVKTSLSIQAILDGETDIVKVGGPNVSQFGWTTNDLTSVKDILTYVKTAIEAAEIAQNAAEATAADRDRIEQLDGDYQAKLIDIDTKYETIVDLSAEIAAGNAASLAQVAAQAKIEVDKLLGIPDGATQLGTSNGSNVQAELDGLKGDVTDLDQRVTQIVESGQGGAEALATLLASSTGATVIGLPQGGKVSDALFSITPEMFGAVGGDDPNLAHANSLCLFRMFEYVRSIGGGLVDLKPNTVYYVDFINFIPSNTYMRFNNAVIKHINPTSAYGRGGLVVGSSREFNYDVAKAAYLAGTYPKSVGSTTFTDPILMQYLENNQSFVQAQNVVIEGARMEAVFTSSALWGGYAINVANAQHVRINNIRGKGWTQVVNFGSDTSPSTPSCFNVRVKGLIVESPDLTRTYYSAGFIANSTECSIEDVTQLVPMTPASLNGSCVATNVVERCHIRNIRVPNLGLTASSEGVLLNNAKKCVVEEIDVRNCVSVVSTYYTLSEFSDSTGTNTIRNVVGQGTYIISLRAKNAVVETFNGLENTTAEVYFGNNNASGNVINKTPTSMAYGGTQLQSWYLTNNTVQGWTRKYFYIRPSEILVNDKIDTTSWDDNILVATKRGVNLSFLWRVPEGIKAIDDIRCYLRFNTAAGADNAFDLGSTVGIDLEQMVTFAGNISELPFVSQVSNQRVAATGQSDTTLVAQMGSNAPGLIYMGDATNGLPYSWYIRIKMTNNGSNNYMKHIRVAGYV